MLPRCVIGRSGMAAYARELYSPEAGAWQRVLAMRSRPFGDGKVPAKCIPKRLAVAIY